MARPSPAIIGSLILHGGVIALIAFAMIQPPQEEPKTLVTSVPVSIISETETVQAAAADNPSEELITEDASTAPTPSEPVPPLPTPTPPRPTPPPPRPTPRPTPPPPQTRPTPPRPTPPRPTPPRQEPTLDLDELAGPPNASRDRGQRPRTGQQGQGTAPRAIGQGDLRALAGQISPHWNVPCELPGGDNLTIGVRVRIAANGSVVGSPRPTQNRSDPTWRAASDSMLRAIRIAAPFDMPSGYQEQEITITFQTANFCRNR